MSPPKEALFNIKDSVSKCNAADFQKVLSGYPDNADELLKTVGRKILKDKKRTQAFWPVLDALGIGFPEQVYSDNGNLVWSIELALAYRNDRAIMSLAESFEKCKMASKFEKNIAWAVCVYYDYKNTEVFSSNENPLFFSVYRPEPVFQINNQERKLKLISGLLAKNLTPNRLAVGNLSITMSNLEGKDQEAYKSLITLCLKKKVYPMLSIHENFSSVSLNDFFDTVKFSNQSRVIFPIAILVSYGVENSAVILESIARSNKVLVQGNAMEAMAKSLFLANNIDLLIEVRNRVYSSDFILDLTLEKNLKEAQEEGFIRGCFALFDNDGFIKKGIPTISRVLECSIEEVFQKMGSIIYKKPNFKYLHALMKNSLAGNEDTLRSFYTQFVEHWRFSNMEKEMETFKLTVCKIENDKDLELTNGYLSSVWEKEVKRIIFNKHLGNKLHVATSKKLNPITPGRF